jgi:hypothetical protein
VIIARNNTEKKSLLDKLNAEMRSVEALERKDEFDIMMRSYEKQVKFIEFCQKNNQAGNMLFLVDVIAYKRESDIQKRVNLQSEIIDKYMTKESPYYLTIKANIIDRELNKRKDGYAPLDAFKYAEEAVRKQLMNGPYRVYFKETHQATEKSETTAIIDVEEEKN